MRNENRTFKNEGKIKATTKAYTVYAKMELIAGRLDKRGLAGKLVAHVKPVKMIPIGQRLDLRVAYKKIDGNTLAYCHGFGWIEVDDLNKVFDTKNSTPIKNDLYEIEYDLLNEEEKTKYQEMIKNANKPKDKKDNKVIKFEDLSNKDKVKYLNEKLVLTNLTKSEKLLIAYIEGKDLKEVTKEIGVDKSLQYKIKKHTEKYEEKFINKFKAQLA